MPAIDDFIAHPRTFLRANILIVFGPDGGTGGVKTASFKKATSTTGRNMLAGGAPMDVYILRVDDTSGTTCQVEWCPYKKDTFQGTTLPGTGGGPKVMFTYGMDGCTFVTGSVTADKSVSVFHVNYASAGGVSIEQQRKLQRNIGRSQVTDAKMIDPDDYYEPSKARVPIPGNAKISTVTFGRRSSDSGWKFYTHQYYTVQGDAMTKHFMGTQRLV
jgi:hypothetical protein